MSANTYVKYILRKITVTVLLIKNNIYECLLCARNTFNYLSCIIPFNPFINSRKSLLLSPFHWWKTEECEGSALPRLYSCEWQRDSPSTTALSVPLCDRKAAKDGVRKLLEGWRMAQIVEHLPSMLVDLGLSPSNAKWNKQKMIAKKL